MRVQVSSPGTRWVQVSAPGTIPTQGRRDMIGYAVIDEGAPVTVRARPETEAGAAILRSAVQTVTLKVYDSADPMTNLWEQDLGSLATMQTVLQTGASWWTDATGYTFEHVLDVAPDFLLEGGKRYRLEYALTLTASPLAVVYVLAEVQTRPVLGARV